MPPVQTLSVVRVDVEREEGSSIGKPIGDPNENCKSRDNYKIENSTGKSRAKAIGQKGVRFRLQTHFSPKGDNSIRYPFFRPERQSKIGRSVPENVG